MYRNLYIHVPFCSKKCDYCAFYSVERADTALQNRWLDRITRDLENAAASLDPIQTVYFGGGTPSLLQDDILEKTFRRILERITLVSGAEITLETNPETVTEEKAAIICKYADRISMGVQSFDPRKRKILGRRPESPDAIPRAVSLLRDAGCRNLGMDMMYAAPGETLKDWLTDLRRLLELNPDHVSAYALTPEENTPYAKAHGITPPDDALSADMWLAAGEILAQNGLPRYEISNYASGPFHAQHNCNVWYGGTYLGLGPAACSFDGTDRFTQTASIAGWLDGTPPEIDRIPPSARLREILMMGLRTVRGWGKDVFLRASGGIHWQQCAEKELASLERDGLLRVSETVCRPTEKGLAFWNEIAERLIL